MMISILFPSRRRLHRAKELCQSIARTVADPSGIEVEIYIDPDEPGYWITDMPFAVDVLHGTRRPKFLSATYNVLYSHCQGDILMYAADDITFETSGWDTVVRERFQQEPVLLLSDSGSPDDVNNVPMHGFVSRRACDALGYLCPPCFEHGFTDRWMLDLYRRAGAPVTFTQQYRIDHHHFSPEPDKMDKVYQERSLDKDENGRTCDDRDRLVFDAKADERARDAAKLRRLL